MAERILETDEGHESPIQGKAIVFKEERKYQTENLERTASKKDNVKAQID